MKIIVITDTHNYIENAQMIIKKTDGVTDVIHLGDMVSDAVELSSMFPEIKFHFIKGNNDWFSNGDEKLFMCACGKNIFAVHGHQYKVKNTLLNIALKAKSIGADVVLFGHTHIMCDTEYDGVRLINPSPYGYAIISDEGIEVYKY